MTISVRSSDNEIAELRARAKQAGVKVTSFFRAAALEASSPDDRAALGELARDLERRAYRVAPLVKGIEVRRDGDITSSTERSTPVGIRRIGHRDGMPQRAPGAWGPPS